MANSPKRDPSAGDDGDDYLTMTFDEPITKPKHETLSERKRRHVREMEERRPKSKAQIAEEERTKRETALTKTLMDTNSKGFKMMQKLGYQAGTALGAAKQPADPVGAHSSDKKARDDRLLEPIGLEVREGRSGIGADAEKKRKFREEMERIEGEDKKRKTDEGDFRERQMKEREEKKMEGQMWGAMKVAEGLAEADETAKAEENGGDVAKQSKRLQSVNVLWRALVKDRLIKERDRRMRYDLHQSLSRLPTYDDPDEVKEDEIAMGRKDRLEEVDLELDQDDGDLDEFEAMPVHERLQKLVSYLREVWHYCFWCKFRYPDAQMEGCPGTTEDDHD